MATCEPTGGRRRVLESDAGGFRILLYHLEVTDEFKDQVPTFVGCVPGIEKIPELRINLQPAMCVPVALVPHTIGPVCGLVRSRVHDHAGYGDAVLLDDQTLRFVDMLP